VGSAWTEKEAAHLLNRAAFSALPAEIEACLALGKEETVRRLIEGRSLTDEAVELPPIEEVVADGKPLKPDLISDQQLYWLYRMARSQAPLVEKMTLFWHGHFATSNQKVARVNLMVRQNEMFRAGALGNFRDLVLAVGKDPAMMVWLDVNSNKKGKPNENYAREVMELFTLGIGNYTEDDVKEAARAFTGWTVNRDTGEVTFNPKQHDNSVKHVLGRSGNFDETSLIDVLFEQKALSRFMAAKLLKFFAVGNPHPDWIEAVAEHFRTKSTVGEVLGNLFLSDEFYKPEYRLALVKSPAEYVAGILRTLNVPLSKGYVNLMRLMGQELYLPPNVAGWKGGESWLMSSLLVARFQFAQSVARKVKASELASAEYRPERKDSGEAWVELWAKKLGLWEIGEPTKRATAQYADETFVHAKQQTAGMRGLLQLLLISPEAQLK